MYSGCINHVKVRSSTITFIFCMILNSSPFVASWSSGARSKKGFTFPFISEQPEAICCRLSPSKFFLWSLNPDAVFRGLPVMFRMWIIALLNRLLALSWCIKRGCAKERVQSAKVLGQVGLVSVHQSISNIDASPKTFSTSMLPMQTTPLTVFLVGHKWFFPLEVIICGNEPKHNPLSSSANQNTKPIVRSKFKDVSQK